MFKLNRCMQALFVATILATTLQAAGSADPWKQSDLMTVEQLRSQSSDVKAGKVILIHVGFSKLYAQGHVPGSQYGGPGNRPEGLALLKKLVEKVPHNRAIIIYCGCCPWDVCPNMRPAFKTLKEMGFTNVKAVEIPNSLGPDWAAKGYPLTQ